MIQNQPGITKTFTPHDWPGLVDELHGHLTTFFTRDHVKQAASELFSKKDLDEHSPPPGHFMIHQVVMGSEEGYGPNNNQDSWPAEMLRREHQTFVTNGHVFREHRNNDPKFAIGSIKAARFSEKLQRVELLKHLQIAKAEKEYEMAKAGKELHASMAAKVPFDVCSICDNRAKYAALYCKDLKNNLGQWMPEFKKYAFARNPQGTFFDSSIVANPAARMAKHLEYRFGPDLQKAASAKVVLSGAQWAEFDQADLGNRFTLDSNSTKLLHKLAAVEGHKGKDNYRAAVSRFAFMPKSSMDDTSWKKVADLMPGSLFHKLAQRRILLPFDAFVAYTTDQTISEVRSNPDTIKCASMLPGIFRALASALETGGCCCGQHDMDMFSGSGNSATAFDPGASDEIDRVMEQASEDWSCDPEPIKSRAVKVIVIKRASINSVMDAPAISTIPPIVQLYGLYKLAALRDILSMTRDQNAEHEMLRLSVDQNLNDQESLTEKV